MKYIYNLIFFFLISVNLFSQGSGNAIAFDGVNDYVDVNAPALTSINNSFTIEFWCLATNTITVKPQQNGISDISGTTGNGQQYVAFPSFGSGAIGAWGNAGAGISIGTNAIQIFEHKASYMPCLLSYTCDLSASWNHIALVYINKTPTLYINGVLVKIGLTSNQTNVFPGGEIGCTANTTHNTYGPFAGTIDEFRIWNYSRTVSDIRNSMCQKLTGSEAGLVRYYKFDEPSGSTTCADASANANGTLNNMNTTTCWQTSGASIGDVSVSDYSGAGNWAGKIVSLPITSNGQIASLSTISAPSSTNEPLGIQLYQVNAVPSITTGLSGIGNQNVYFGAYVVNPSNLSQLTNSSTYNFNIDVTGYNPTNNNSTYTRANNTNTFAIGVNNAGTTNYVLIHSVSTNYQNEIIALQTISITSPASTATYCAGQSLNVTYTVAPSTYSIGNVFVIELSDATGSFASPVSIGTLSAVNDGTVSCIIPSNTPQGTLYKIRISSSLPAVTQTSSVNFTILPLPTTAVTATVSNVICSGLTTTTLTATGANTYSWVPSVGLSATTGSVVIANPTVNTNYTVTGTNSCSSSNAVITVTVQNIVPAAPTPTAFGNGFWNVYCFDNPNYTNYFGYYTENNLNINSQTRWSNGTSPSNANASSGQAYQGCTIANNNYSTISKRTNFICGIYQIDVPAHDDDIAVLIDGVQIFSHGGCCDSHTNVWRGFLTPTSTVEIRQLNGHGPGYYNVNFISIGVALSPPVTICASSSTTLTATPFISGANYSWSPAASLSSSIGTLVVASPTTGTDYTCTVTNAAGTCSVANSVSITVNPLPSTSVAPTSATISCPSQSITLTVGGANTYSWSPSAGLNTTTGASVIATPTITTVYTVTGNNNCASISATTAITVVPLVSPTVFGNNTWNVYCYNGSNFDQYFGFYTENNLTFSTLNRWGSLSTPSAAITGTMGLAYQGCTLGVDYHSTIHKRTNFTCGYYQIDIPFHDDNVTVFINGAQVFQHIGCCDSHTNIWTGFLGPTSTVEIRQQEGVGGSGLAASFFLLSTRAPGGVASGLNLWLKADGGVTGTTNVTTWNDYSGNCMHAIGVNSPTLNASSSNYNPSISFNGASNSNTATTTSSYFYLPSGFSSFNGATSFLSLNPTTTGVFQRFFDFGNGFASNNIWFGRLSSSNQICYETFNGSAGGQRIASGGSLINNRMQVVTSNHMPATNAVTLQNNGVNFSVGNAQPLQNITRNLNYLGLSNWSADAGFGGLMSEVILYNRSLTNNEQQRVNTYLGIKYSVTQNISGMSSAYLSTASSTVFTDGGMYWNTIIGIGRDDAESLYQKQSKADDDSVRIYAGTLANTNQLNTATITNTLSYVVIGSNNGYLSMGNNNSEKPIVCNLFSRINREWKVMNTNYTNSFSMDIKLNNAAQTNSVNIAHLRLLVDDDGDFSSGTTSCYFNGDGTGITISYVAPVITIKGISNTHIPNNSTRYITIASTNSATPLPIELVNFEAIYNTVTKHVDLNWQTATQRNNDYFTTERSIDGINWEQVKQIDGSGTNTSYLSYTSVDEKPYTGLSYYRLKQTDFNGAYSYSAIRDVVVNDNTSASKVIIIPNPANTLITVQWTGLLLSSAVDEMKNTPTTITVYNTLGQPLISQTITDTNIVSKQIDIRNLAEGMYYIKVENAFGQQVKTIVKKH